MTTPDLLPGILIPWSRAGCVIPGIRILPMPAHLEADVRELYAEGHPGWAPVSEHWFQANPTLVAIDDVVHAVVGYASYTMNVTDAGRLAIYLQDTVVAQGARGQGLGHRLMAHRLEIARSLGAEFAVGVTQPDNRSMRQILEAAGFLEMMTIPGAYTQSRPPVDGVLYRRDL